MRESGKGPCSPGCGEGMLPHSFCCKCGVRRQEHAKTKNSACTPAYNMHVCHVCGFVCGVRVVCRGGGGVARRIPARLPFLSHSRAANPHTTTSATVACEWPTAGLAHTLAYSEHRADIPHARTQPMLTLNIAQTGGGATRSIIPTCMAPPPSQRARRHTADMVSEPVHTSASRAPHTDLAGRRLLRWSSRRVEGRGVDLPWREGLSHVCCHLSVGFSTRHTPWCVLWCMYVCRATRRGLTRVACYIALP